MTGLRTAGHGSRGATGAGLPVRSSGLPARSLPHGGRDEPLAEAALTPAPLRDEVPRPRGRRHVRRHVRRCGRHDGRRSGAAALAAAVVGVG